MRSMTEIIFGDGQIRWATDIFPVWREHGLQFEDRFGASNISNLHSLGAANVRYVELLFWMYLCRLKRRSCLAELVRITEVIWQCSFEDRCTERLGDSHALTPGKPSISPMSKFKRSGEALTFGDNPRASKLARRNTEGSRAPGIDESTQSAFGQPVHNAFGPIDAKELIDESGSLSSAYVASNAIKRNLSRIGNRRSLIVGRKGSGKTTLLYMSKSKEKIDCILDIGGEFASVVDALSLERRTRFTETASRVWSTVIWNTIIVTVYDRLYSELQYLSEIDQVILHSYVDSITKDIYGRIGARRVLEAPRELADQMKNRSIKLAAAMIRAALESDLDVDQVKVIIDRLLRLSERKASVLVDTMEFYDIQLSQAASDCIRGLLHCCATLHQESDGVECRLFFPDELTHHVKTNISSSVLKDFRDVDFLSWTSSQLVCLAALRLRDRMQEYNLPGWELHNLTFDDVGHAQSVFHRFLPTLVTNDRGVQFEVLSYILRHTQRTPRQLFIVLNWLGERYFVANGKNLDTDRPKLTESDVHAAVKRCALEIHTDVMGTYREIYPSLEKIIIKILPRLNRTFDDKELYRAFEEERIEERFSYDFEELKYALSDVGAVGVVDRFGSNNNTVSADFAYMTDQRLILSASKKYCAHPIFSSVHEPREPGDFTVFPSGSSVFDS